MVITISSDLWYLPYKRFMFLRTLLQWEALETTLRPNRLSSKTGNMFESQPPWTQTFLNWSPLWMIEVMVAMFKLVQGILPASSQKIPWEIGCSSGFRTADTGYLLLVTWEIWLEFLAKAQDNSSQGPSYSLVLK